MIVIETSALLEWLLRGSRSAAIDEFLAKTRVSLCAPHLLDTELIEVLRRYVDAGEVSPQRASELLQDVDKLAIQRYGHESYLERIWKLSESIDAASAAFIALAEGRRGTLLTCDPSLKAAAGPGVKVELI